MKVTSEQFREVAKGELKTRHTRSHLDFIGLVIGEMRRASMSTFPDPSAALELGRAIRAESVDRLPDILEEFERNATAHGAVVYWARDADEANAIILRIAQERNVRLITKGKSMVTEETALNDVLTENGLEVLETDLGEFIIQLLGRPPFHIVGPALNIPAQEICDLFMEKGIMMEPTLEPVELGHAARVFLREKFHHMDMAITGVNFAVAQTGTIINVENEGNIRLTKSSPRTQVSIMTLEKVVPTMQDAMHMLRLLCRNCTGQKIASYVSMDSGPNKGSEVDGPRELFIVILDNGRSGFYRDIEAREILRCIRCGVCESGRGCPRGIATTDPDLSLIFSIDWATQRLVNLFHSWSVQLQDILWRCGLTTVRQLVGRTDLLVHLDYDNSASSRVGTPAGTVESK